jgi:hypothetical protein
VYSPRYAAEHRRKETADVGCWIHGERENPSLLLEKTIPFRFPPRVTGISVAELPERGRNGGSAVIAMSFRREKCNRFQVYPRDRY